jgi:hypothetical protein
VEARFVVDACMLKSGATAMSKHLRALEVEALAYSNLTGANDAHSPGFRPEAASVPAAQPISRARVALFWIAVTSLFGNRRIPGSQAGRTMPE